MIGRQLFLESVDDRSEQWRRNECLRQLVTMRTQQGPPIAQLTRMPLSRNDGFTLDLNLIVLDDPYLRAPRINTTDQYLLEYIRQMEERYAAMERELTRTKMMLPLISRNTVSAHQSANVNWKECSLANKYGSNAGKSSESRRGTIVGARDFNQNRERTNVFSRRMRHARQGVDSTVDRTNWRNCRNSFQNDVYPIRDPASHACRPRTWGNDSAAVCSTHNVAMIIPQDPISPPNVSRHDQTRPRPDVRKYFSNGYANARLQADNNNILEADSNRDAAKMFDGSAKSSIAINTQKTQFLVKTALMEACQRSDEKQEPETSRCIDSDVKHEDHKQAGFTVNGSILPTTVEPKLRRENSERKPASTASAGSSDDLAEKRALKRIKYFENSFARREENRLEKLQQERIRSMNEQARNLARMIQRNARAQKRVPTPRSNVHTACTPMMQPVLTNQMLDPNGMTIRLLRLAVLLYAPALLPALNSLIAQQSSQTTIPIPCFDGSNDLLTQLLRVLGSQQRVPNLSYTASPRSEETPQNPRVASSSSPRTMSNPEPGFQRREEGTRRIMQLPRKMSAQNLNPEKTNSETGSRENKPTGNEIRFAGDERKDKLYEPKHKQKLVRVLTVVAYVIFVSMGAILLSLYYTFVWDPKDVTVRIRPKPECVDTKLPNSLTTLSGFNETQAEKTTVRSVSDGDQQTEELKTAVRTSTISSLRTNSSTTPTGILFIEEQDSVLKHSNVDSVGFLDNSSNGYQRKSLTNTSSEND